MSTLKVTPETFLTMVLGLVKAGVIFNSVENEGWIVITFTGSF
jgi:hypothetical protein